MSRKTYESLLPTPEKCVAHKKNGERCGAWPIKGATVCGKHGGKARQVREKAKRRIENAADRMARLLLEMAEDESVPHAIRLAAIKDALDRAGLTAKFTLDVEADWKIIIQDVIGEVGDDEAKPLPARYRDVVEVEGEVVSESPLAPTSDKPGDEIHIVEGGTVYDMNTRSRVRPTRRSPSDGP